MNSLAPDTFDVSVARITSRSVKLDVQELDFFYGKNHALKGVSMPVAEKAVTALPFGQFLMNSFFLTLTCVVGQILSGSLVAYSFARLRWPGPPCSCRAATSARIRSRE